MVHELVPWLSHLSRLSITNAITDGSGHTSVSQKFAFDHEIGLYILEHHAKVSPDRGYSGDETLECYFLRPDDAEPAVKHFCASGNVDLNAEAVRAVGGGGWDQSWASTYDYADIIMSKGRFHGIITLSHLGIGIPNKVFAASGHQEKIPCGNGLLYVAMKACAVKMLQQ